MNHAIRRVGIAVTVLHPRSSSRQLTYLQVVDADELDQRPPQRAQRSCATSTGHAARSSPPTARSSPARSRVDDDFEYQREYPLGELFAQIAGYQSFVVGNTGVENVVQRRAHRHARPQLDSLAQHRRPALGKQTIGNVVLTLSADAQQSAGDRSATGRARVVAPRPADRRGRRHVLEPDLRPEPARRPQPAGRAGLLRRHWLNADPRTRLLPACVPRALPAGFDVQDRHHRASALDDRHRRHPTTEFPTLDGSILAPQPNQPIANFGGELVRRHARRRASCGRATRRSRRSASTSARSSRPAWPSAASRQAPPTRRRARARSEQWPQAGTFDDRQAALRARRHRPGRRWPSRRCRWRWSRPAVANGGVIMRRTSASRSATPTATP